MRTWTSRREFCYSCSVEVRKTLTTRDAASSGMTPMSFTVFDLDSFTLKRCSILSVINLPSVDMWLRGKGWWHFFLLRHSIQSHTCYWSASMIWSTSPFMVPAGLLLDRSGTLSDRPLHKCGLATSHLCTCSHWQTVNHIIDLCPLTSRSSKAAYNLCTTLATRQSTGWIVSRLRHLEMKSHYIRVI